MIAYITERGEYWHIRRSDVRNTLIYAHTTWRTLPACYVGLGSLTLPASEAGDFVELILVHVTERNSYPTSSLDLAPHTIHMMYAKTLTDKLAGLQTKITLTFSNPLVPIPHNLHWISFILEH